jgi:hypothetical protein
VQESQKIPLLWSHGSNGGQGDDCTGFFVSKKDFLTARHCVPRNPETKITIDLGDDRGNIKGKCVRFPGERDDAKDWAICNLEDNLAEGEFPLARCAPKPDTLAVIMGFCQVEELEKGEEIEIILNAGVVQLMEAEGGFLPAKLVAISGCPINSGGVAFVSNLEEPSKGFFISSGAVSVVGVISSIGVCPESEPMRTCIAPVGNSEFLDFLDEHRTEAVTVVDCGG